MNHQLRETFSAFSAYDIALIGSSVWNFDAAKDIDILFFDKKEFLDACLCYGKVPQEWDSPTGRVAKALILLPNVEKPIQLLWNASATSWEDHPFSLMLPSGVILKEHRHFVKDGGWKSAKTLSVDRRKESKPVIAVDFDGTIRDWDTSLPLEGAREVLSDLRAAGYYILIHSANNPDWIENWLNDQDIRYDGIWKGTGKPVASIYLDDRGLRFSTWERARLDILGEVHAEAEASDL
jgi:hypothetical protein